jgi:glycerol uptake facilitator-like aquaporin
MATMVYVFVVCHQVHLNILSRGSRDIFFTGVSVAMAYYVMNSTVDNFSDQFLNPAVTFAQALRFIILGQSLDWYYAFTIFFGNWIGGFLGGELFRYFYPATISHHITVPVEKKDDEFKA